MTEYDPEYRTRRKNVGGDRPEPWRWNETIPLAELCGSCDGKDAPVPTCEFCDGTGRETVKPAMTAGERDLTARLRRLIEVAAQDPSWVGRGVTVFDSLITEAADRIEALEAELDALAENADAFINLGFDATLTAEDGTEVAWGGFWMQVDVEVWRRLYSRWKARFEAEHPDVADLPDGA